MLTRLQVQALIEQTSLTVRKYLFRHLGRLSQLHIPTSSSAQHSAQFVIYFFYIIIFFLGAAYNTDRLCSGASTTPAH